MKLGLHGWQMGKVRTLDEMVDLVAAAGLASFEIMIHPEFKSSIALELSASEKSRIKEKFKSSGVQIAALSVTCRYDSQDPAEVRRNIDATKRWAELARELGAPRLRCLGDRLHEDKGEAKEVTIARIATALRECAEFGETVGVDCPIEMHGHFTAWEHALAVVEQVKHPRCYLVHNGQPGNTPPERWDEVWAKLRPWIKHVHVHDILDAAFPHKKFFRQLRDDGYTGLISLELKPSDDPLRVLQLTKALFEEWVAR